jgi:1-acyl-sn-glycerol-3-phosphate acyltransferase
MKNIFRLLWRIWFYILFGGLIFVFAPVLLIVTAKEKWYPVFFKIARLWANIILIGMGFRIKKRVVQEIKKEDSYMFIANHTSIIDVMLMLAVTKNPFVFVGKQELAKIPVFGFFYKRTCILVDRKNIRSKQKVFMAAQQKIDAGLSICIFPEGLVPEDETIVLDNFKKGAFRLAIEHSLPIVPMSFYDCKKRFSYTFFTGSPGLLRVKIHSFFETTHLNLDETSVLQNQCHDLIYEDLILNSKTS